MAKHKPKQTKEKFDVGKTLPNMINPAGQKPRAPKSNKPEAITLPDEAGKKFSWKKGVFYFLLIILILFVASLGWLSYKFQKNCAKVFNDCTVFSLLDNTPLKGEDSGRVNILLAGNSVDDPGHSGAQLTDSVMLISLNTRDHTGYLLSIPRDLYVDYGTTNCSYGDAGKINAVYECGQSQNFQEAGYPDGGMGLLEKVVSQDFGVPINYYGLVSYNAFRDSVNAVGGITINIQSSDPRGIYDPSLDYTSATCCALANYPNGPATLNGKQALDLSRARGDAYGSYGFARSDFDRTANQRLMLTALKDKASSLGTLINPIKLGNLLDAVGKNVQTDFGGNNIHRLASLVKSVPHNKLQSVGLNNVAGKNYLASYSGSLIPAAGIGDFSQIQDYIQSLNQQ